MDGFEGLEAWHKEASWKVVRETKVRDEESPDARAVSEAAETR